jgi:hypothetical protein
VARSLILGLACGLAFAAAPQTSRADFIFGFSGGDGPGNQTLTVTTTTGVIVFDTADSQFDVGVDNQGWWSATNGNFDPNDNYFVGDVAGHLLNNFFTFDVSLLLTIDPSTILSATLSVLTYGVQDDPPPNAAVLYTLFDVSTDAATLNDQNGVSAAIFTDLGSGVSYGSVAVPLLGPPPITSISLNAAAIADMIAAAPSQYFSIGGTLSSIDAVATPEPASLVLLGMGAIGFIGLRRRQQPS